MTLDAMLRTLEHAGCYPGIYRRGQSWRAHVNIGGGYWEDANTPNEAMRAAMNLWERDGCRMDGEAAGVERLKAKEDVT